MDDCRLGVLFSVFDLKPLASYKYKDLIAIAPIGAVVKRLKIYGVATTTVRQWYMA